MKLKNVYKRGKTLTSVSHWRPVSYIRPNMHGSTECSTVMARYNVLQWQYNVKHNSFLQLCTRETLLHTRELENSKPAKQYMMSQKMLSGW